MQSVNDQDLSDRSTCMAKPNRNSSDPAHAISMFRLPSMRPNIACALARFVGADSKFTNSQSTYSRGQKWTRQMSAPSSRTPVQRILPHRQADEIGRIEEDHRFRFAVPYK